MATNQDSLTILPSGKYAVDEVERGIVRVLQLIENSKAPEFADYDGCWFSTPGRWHVTTLLANRPAQIFLDFGQGWQLDFTDTTALLEFASDVEVDLW